MGRGWGQGERTLSVPRTAWSPWSGEPRSFSFPLRLNFVLCSCCFNLVIWWPRERERGGR